MNGEIWPISMSAWLARRFCEAGLDSPPSLLPLALVSVAVDDMGDTGDRPFDICGSYKISDTLFPFVFLVLYNAVENHCLCELDELDEESRGILGTRYTKLILSACTHTLYM